MGRHAGFRPSPAGVGSVLFIGAIAAMAHLGGAGLLMFPELGALSNDIFKRPGGTWARAPAMLLLTPLLTAVAGLLIARHMSFGLAAVLLDVGASVTLIHLMRSPIAPAISAGLLPLVLGVHSWWYPPAITFGTAALAVLSVIRRRIEPPVAPSTARDVVDDTMECTPSAPGWLPPFMIVVALLAGLAQATGLRFILFPPLVVIAFEMFAHPQVCPWAVRAWRLPLACALGAAAGVAAVGLFGAGAAAAMTAMAVGLLVLHRLDLHAPPVLAVGLLPLVMPHPGWPFVVAVATGTSLCIVAFRLWQAVAARWTTCR
ncbi:MAG: hypothetical protein KGH90_13315 [Xanthomonadaceae bacterium]|jgi:hypothetical protein|nr:hypothetical protein [Xanthomonadaceae bacterium]